VEAFERDAGSMLLFVNRIVERLPLLQVQVGVPSDTADQLENIPPYALLATASVLATGSNVTAADTGLTNLSPNPTAAYPEAISTNLPSWSSSPMSPTR
jgi:hypothetical protein